MTTPLLGALLVLSLGGLVALTLGARPRAANAAGVASAVAGCGLGLAAGAGGLLGRGDTFVRPWNVPYGSFSVAIDQLSAVFLIAIFGLGALAAIYGGAYVTAYRGKKPLGVHWFFFNVMIASMALVVAARNGMLFLVAWEAMAIASFFLVSTEHEKAEVRSAARVYLIATHIGTAFLLVFFALLGREAGSLDFDRFEALRDLAPATAAAIFLCAIVGFGTKAGFMPAHVWLPEAHPAAPSHVSALMSGVMIKTGVYGILRALTFLDDPPVWWGMVLIGIGLTSGVLGVLFALAQHDLKRLLAYHSVENIGIIALGMGVGLLGVAYGATTLALLGFAGALLHVVNHAIFKGLLFLGAGSVLHATGDRETDRLGGLLRRMPVTGGTFLIAAAAIAGVPPLNGFVSEFLIALGALRGVTSLDAPGTVLVLATVVAGLGLIAGLAVACFAKAGGVVFLGAPRSDEAAHAHEGGLALKLPMLTLAVLCVGIGVAAVAAVRVVAPAAGQLAGVDPTVAGEQLASWSTPVAGVTFVALGVVGLTAALLLLRLRLLAGRNVASTVTWDCGYERPTARMQYSSGSFAEPLTTLFRRVLLPRVALVRPRGLFPRRAVFASITPDLAGERGYRPIWALIEWTGDRLHFLQQGRVHVYLLYIFVTLIVLLAVHQWL